MWWQIAIGVLCGLLLAWAALLIVLAVARPDSNRIRESLRLLPDLLRLLRSLAADPQLPRGVRIRLGLMAAYLAFPIDLVPDFIPVLGYADDAIVVALGLRSVVRHAGGEAIERHWSGSQAGLEAVLRIAGVS